MSRVTFRDLEERDIYFVYRCKNNEKLNALVCIIARLMYGDKTSGFGFKRR